MVSSLMRNLLYKLYKNVRRWIERSYLDQGKSRHTGQVIHHCSRDPYRHNVSHLCLSFDKDHAINLRCVSIGAPDGNPLIAALDQDIQRLADIGLIYL